MIIQLSSNIRNKWTSKYFLLLLSLLALSSSTSLSPPRPPRTALHWCLLFLPPSPIWSQSWGCKWGWKVLNLTLLVSLKRKLKWRPHSKIGSAEREEKVNNSLFLLPSPGSGPSPSVSQHRPSYRSRWMQLPTLGCQLVHTEHHFSHGRSQSSRGKGSGDAISNSQARGGGPERCSGKKSKIRTGEWSLYPSGWEWSSSPVITECANQVLCALQKHEKWYIHPSYLKTLEFSKYQGWITIMKINALGTFRATHI